MQAGYINALDSFCKSFYPQASWDTHVLQGFWKKLPQEHAVIFLAVRFRKITALVENYHTVKQVRCEKEHESVKCSMYVPRPQGHKICICVVLGILSTTMGKKKYSCN